LDIRLKRVDRVYKPGVLKICIKILLKVIILGYSIRMYCGEHEGSYVTLRHHAPYGG